MLSAALLLLCNSLFLSLHLSGSAGSFPKPLPPEKERECLERCAAGDGVVDARRACVLIRYEDRALVVRDLAVLVQLTGHDGRNVRTGKARDECDAALARDAEERTEQGTEQNVRRLECAELLEYAEQAAEEHDRRDQVEACHEAVLRAGAALADEVRACVADLSERACQIGKVKYLDRSLRRAERTGQHENEHNQCQPCADTDLFLVFRLFLFVCHEF